MDWCKIFTKSSPTSLPFLTIQSLRSSGLSGLSAPLKLGVFLVRYWILFLMPLQSPHCICSGSLFSGSSGRMVNISPRGNSARQEQQPVSSDSSAIARCERWENSYKGLATLQIIRLGRKWIIHDHARMLIMSSLTDSLTH